MHRLQNLCLAVASCVRAYARVLAGRGVLPTRQSPTSPLCRALLLATLLCGVVFYLGYRSDVLYWIVQQFMPDALPYVIPSVFLPALPWAVYHSLPSLLGGLSAVLFVACLHPVNRFTRYVALTASITTLLLFELGLGYFHALDIAATVVGLLVGLCLIGVMRWYGEKMHSTQTQADADVSAGMESDATNAQRPVFPVTAAIVFSSFLAVGSTWTDGFSTSECARFGEDGFCEEYKRSAQPVYMSYQNLRNAVQVEAPRAPDRIGRLYLYANFVFLNEINEGIHVIDNTEPTAPVNLGFIRIPGNTEIAIRDNYLYADSYVDLLTLDINDPQNVSVINREQSIFPYDEYQNIPQNISLSDAQIDRDLGVVVSYRLNGS